MKIAPFIDPDGIACDRERAAYRAELITERDRFLIAFLPMAEDGLTYLERVGVFSIPLHPGIDRETALRPRYMVTGAPGQGSMPSMGPIRISPSLRPFPMSFPCVPHERKAADFCWCGCVARSDTSSLGGLRQAAAERSDPGAEHRRSHSENKIILLGQIRSAFVATALVASVPATAISAETGPLENGFDLARRCESSDAAEKLFCVSFLSGVYTTAIALGELVGPPVLCTASSVSGADILAMSKIMPGTIRSISTLAPR
jgi:hypothetical protein